MCSENLHQVSPTSGSGERPQELGLVASNHLSATFEQWEAGLNGIYYIKNGKRSSADMWLRAYSDASKVGEAVRKRANQEAIHYMTHTFGWFIVSIKKFQDEGFLDTQWSMTDILLHKYPNLCPYCLQVVGCICSGMRKSLEAMPEQEKNAYMARRSAALQQGREAISASRDFDRSIAGLASMLYRIYSEAHHSSDLNEIAFHFLEEIGEVSICLASIHDGSKPKAGAPPFTVQLVAELADTVAWGLAVLAKILDERHYSMFSVRPSAVRSRKDLGASSLDPFLLPAWLWSVYTSQKRRLLRCPRCFGARCRC